MEKKFQQMVSEQLCIQSNNTNNNYDLNSHNPDLKEIRGINLPGRT